MRTMGAAALLAGMLAAAVADTVPAREPFEHREFDAHLEAPFRALPGRDGGAAAAQGALPYTVHYANLHSQTNHSDGGRAVAQCDGSQHPQSGESGPAEAYAYARDHGLDILATTEHNHMYDGSDGTNGNADAGAARALYRAGLAIAAQFNASHPGFAAIYGQEWASSTTAAT